jgi:hypothetical protein
VEQFLRNNYSFLIHLIEIISALIGIICYKKYKHTYVKYFVFYLIYIALIELIGAYPKHLIRLDLFNVIEGTIFEKNRWWFTIFWKIGGIMFFWFYFQKILKTELYIKVIKYFGLLFLIFSICNIIINFNYFFSHSLPSISIFGTLIILLCTIFYFIEVLQSNRILTFYKSLNFYIAVTIFIWWLIITPLVFYDIYFSTADWDFVILKWQIYLFSNFFMYLIFAIALIVSKPEYD